MKQVGFFLTLLLVLSIRNQGYSQDKGAVIAKLDSLFGAYVQIVNQTPATAKQIAGEILNLSKENGLALYTAKAHYVLGNLAYKEGKFDITTSEINAAIKILTSLQTEQGMPACYNLLALSQKGIGNLPKAMEHFMEGLAIAKKLEDHLHVANTYQNIATIYFQQKQFQLSIENLDRAREIYQQIDHEDGIITTLFNFANILKEQGKYKEAKNHYQEVLAYHEKTNNQTKAAYVKINLSQMLMEEEKYKEALPQLLETLTLLETLHLISDMAIVYNDLGLCHLKLGNVDEAHDSFNKALDISDASNPPYFKGEIYMNLSQLYRTKQDFKNALLYYEKSTRHRDEINSIEKEKHVAELQEEYETALKEARISLLEKEQDLQKAELQKAELFANRQRIITNSLVAGISLVSITLIILRYFYLQKIKAQKKLAFQQEENSRQAINQLIKDYKIATIERFHEGQIQERSRVAREIHDGIGSDLASLKMSLEHFLEQKGMDANGSRIMTGIHNACKDLRNLSHQLHPPPFSQIGFCSFLKDFLDQKCNGIAMVHRSFFFPEDDIDLLPDPLLADIYRIIQELVTNIIKHADATEMDVQLTLHEYYINIVVIDNGKGMPAKKASGIGLRNIRERLQSINGAMHLETSKTGTLINIDISLNSQQQTS